MKLLRSLWDRLSDDGKLAADRRAFLRGMTYTSAGLLVGVPVISIPREPLIEPELLWTAVPAAQGTFAEVMQALIEALQKGMHGAPFGVPVAMESLSMPPFDSAVIKRARGVFPAIIADERMPPDEVRMGPVTVVNVGPPRTIPTRVKDCMATLAQKLGA